MPDQQAPPNATADGVTAQAQDSQAPDSQAQKSPEALMDRYILAKTRLLIDSVTRRMDAYDLPGATAELEGFIDSLNNWYIRRNRDRFWAPARPSSADDKQQAYNTLYTVLTTLTRLLAPFLPLVSEEIHRGLTGAPSVHLCDWPDPTELPDDPSLVAAMDRVRDVCSTGLRVREDEGIRVRQPLKSLTVAGRNTDSLMPFTSLIAEEVNVKAVNFSDDLTAYGEFALRPNGQELGPRLGKQAQEVFVAARSSQWEFNDDGTVTAAGHTLTGDEFELALNPVEGTSAAALPSGDGLVALDTAITAELSAEGIARDVVRVVQAERKAHDLNVTDRIRVTLQADAEIIAAVEAHETYVCEQILAVNLSLETNLESDPPDDPAKASTKIDAGSLAISLEKAAR